MHKSLQANGRHSFLQDSRLRILISDGRLFLYAHLSLWSHSSVVLSLSLIAFFSPLHSLHPSSLSALSRFRQYLSFPLCSLHLSSRASFTLFASLSLSLSLSLSVCLSLVYCHSICISCSLGFIPPWYHLNLWPLSSRCLISPSSFSLPLSALSALASVSLQQYLPLPASLSLSLCEKT
jgi:hypothetical protein